MTTRSHVLVIMCLILTGCAGVVLESTRISESTATRNNHMQAALAGDAEAQYLVGKSFCCAPRNDTDAFYNNRKATEFLCKAARQHHARAAYELGRIHSGDTIEGIRLLRRVATLVRGESIDNEVVAYYWFQQAALAGDADAKKALAALAKRDVSTYTDPATAPCTLDEVYGAQG